MAAFPRFPVLTRGPTRGFTGAVPTGGGLLAGGVVSAGIALLPTDTLEHLVWTSGVAALVPAAQPPLGPTARALLAAGGGLVTAAVVWSALFLLFGPGGFLERKPRVKTAAVPSASRMPNVRRADAHPDAPPRRPMTAADLGTPLMEVGTPPVEQPLPADLDQPLAAFDPAALAVPTHESARTAPALAPGERIETFALTPPPPATAPRAARREPASAQSIDALLRRLEEGAGRRSARA
jgi:hypothetical protein